MTGFAALVDELAEALAPTPTTCRTGCSGTAAGAARLRTRPGAARAGRTGPAHVFVSAEPAPDHPRPAEELHTLGDAEFVARIAERAARRRRSRRTPS
ncbi:hypothetical protein NKH77_01105 [Streptomyces sp. M19]